MHDDSATHDEAIKRKMLEDLEQLKHSVIHAKERHFNALAGSAAEVLLQSRAQAEAHLAHSNPLVRRAAIIAIVDHWGSSPAFEEYCINTLLRESNVELQITALSAITKVYQGTADSRIIQILKDVLRKQAYHQELAGLAYLALFRVLGKSVDGTIRMRILKRQFQCPADIDWALIDNLSGGKEKGEE